MSDSEPPLGTSDSSQPHGTPLSWLHMSERTTQTLLWSREPVASKLESQLILQNELAASPGGAACPSSRCRPDCTRRKQSQLLGSSFTAAT